MATAFIESKSVTRIRMPPAATIWNSRVWLLGVVVDLDRQCRVAVERALGQPRGSSRPRRPSAAGPSRRSPATGRGSCRSRCPAAPTAARGRGPPASGSRPVPGPPGAAIAGTARSASWVVITMIGRISRLSVSTPAKQRRAQRQGLDPEGPDEEGQARGCRRRSTARRPGWRCWSG